MTEIRLKGEKCFLTCVYRSPSQNHDKFEDFCTKFYLVMCSINNELPLCSVITGDFYGRCSRWWKNDITNSIKQEIDFLTSLAGHFFNKQIKINNLFINLPMLLITLCNALTSYFVQTRM